MSVLKQTNDVMTPNRVNDYDPGSRFRSRSEFLFSEVGFVLKLVSSTEDG